MEMNMMKNALLAAALMVAPMAASAAPVLSGTFTVRAVNVTNLTSDQSQATMGNFNAALAVAQGGPDNFSPPNSTYVWDDFTYTGLIDFNSSPVGRNDPYTVEDWLETGTGSFSGLSGALSMRQLSQSNINNGTAETTFFLFTLVDLLTSGDFTIRHDDGIALREDGTVVFSSVGPNTVRTTPIDGVFQGGELSILYVATNGNPSIFEVSTTATVVPLPAGGLLLLGGLGALAVAARRRRAAA
jgi:hypothetical protein